MGLLMPSSRYFRAVLYVSTNSKFQISRFADLKAKSVNLSECANFNFVFTFS